MGIQRAISQFSIFQIKFVQILSQNNQLKKIWSGMFFHGTLKCVFKYGKL